MRAGYGLVAAGLAAVAVAGCGGSDSGSSGSQSGGGLPASIKVGFLNSMTGPAGFCGQQELQGAKLAAQEATRDGMLGKGVKVSVDVADDKGQPETAVAGVQQLLNDDVPAIVGPCAAPMATASVPITQQRKIPQVLTTAGGADISGDYAFRAGIPQQEYAARAIDAVSKAGAKKVAVIWDKSQPTVATPVWKDVQKPQIAKDGMQLTDDEAVTTDQTDFSNQVGQLLAGKPDAIGVLLVGAANLTVVKQLREAGFKGTIWGQEGMLNDAYIKAGPAVEGTLIPVGYAPNFTDASSVKFTKDFQAAYHETPAELSAHGYDGMLMVLDAIKAAGSTDRDAVQKALAAMKSMQGAQGAVTFTADGDARGSGGVTVVKGGGLQAYDEGR